MKTIPPEEFKAIVDRIMRDYAPLMRRLAAFEAISHLPNVEWVRPPEREAIDDADAPPSSDVTSSLPVKEDSMPHRKPRSD